MGMDLVAIFPHKFTKNEILQLPKLIDNNNFVKNLVETKYHGNILSKPKTFPRKTNWSGSTETGRIMDEKNLARIWKHYKYDTEIDVIEGLCHDTELDCYFGDLSIYENTITATPFPEHKYGNLRNPVTSKYVFNLNRALAKFFNTNIIVYCCDSYYHPSILEEKSRMGWTIESIIKFGNDKFGIPPKEINEAIENLYFIDEFDINLDKLDVEKKVWSRAKYEYDKEQKNEKPYD